MCHSGYDNKSHWHTLSDTFSLGDTTFQRQKMCHSGYVYCTLKFWFESRNVTRFWNVVLYQNTEDQSSNPESAQTQMDHSVAHVSRMVPKKIEILESTSRIQKSSDMNIWMNVLSCQNLHLIRITRHSFQLESNEFSFRNKSTMRTQFSKINKKFGYFQFYIQKSLST